METKPTSSLPPIAQKLIGYALAFALAYIAAKWGIVPVTPQPTSVIVVPAGPATPWGGSASAAPVARPR